MRRSLKGAVALAALVWTIAPPVAGQQQAPESLLPPGFGAPPPPRSAAPPPPAAAAGGPAPASPLAPSVPSDALPPADDVLANDVAALPAPPPQPELPDFARRSLDQVGVATGYGDGAFGAVDGRFVVTLMRRIDTPIASRWAEIVLRRMLVAPTPAPTGEARADWVADRAALLLKLGEADAARMLVAGVDVESQSPRLRRVAVQAALATADPAALCPLPDGGEQIAGQSAWPMIRAMCAALSGDAATANATIGRAPPGDPIDHALAEKVVAAGGAGRRAVPIDWTAVDTLTDWRFGLATALNVVIPQALLDAAPVWFQAWLARAPMLKPAERIAPARVAAAIGPLSSADLVDLYGEVADAAGDLDTDSPSGRLRAAYRGDDDAAKLEAMHALWDAAAKDQPTDRDRYAGWILTARAAAAFVPSRDRASDVGEIVASLFSAGLDIQAERWAGIVAGASGAGADRAWAVLAVGARRAPFAIDRKRIDGIAARDGDVGRQRGAMLAAALGGLGRLPFAEAQRVAGAAGADLAVPTPYARALGRAVDGGEPGTVALLVATGMQSASWTGVPAPDFYRMIQALRAVGLETEARMIAAEAMSRL